MTSQRFEDTLAAIDAANSKDPRRVAVDGSELPVELIYGQRMSEVLDELAPDASELLKIAVRAQHIERWTSPRKDYPDGKFTLAFIGYGDESENTVIELTYNWDTDSYDIGTGYGHIALEVDDVYEATEEIRNRGGKIVRDAGPMNAGTTIIAFVEDPDGYPIELIGKKH